MTEYIREIEVRCEVDTNKRTLTLQHYASSIEDAVETLRAWMTDNIR